MELSGFSVGEDFISLVHEGGRLDLHNDYAFVELRHRPMNRTALLAWSRRASEWTSQQLPRAVELHFSEVHLLKVAQRHPEMPHSEDDCVSMLGFLWDELVEEMNGCAKVEVTPECSHLVVVFQGGSAVKLGAKAAGLVVSGGA